MIYAMADIHGQYDKYIAMLEKINFSDNDILFVLGDVIDRGSQGMAILKDMMMRTNVYPILGNHEYMAITAIPWLMQEITEETVEKIDPEMMQGLIEWMNVGGSSSIIEFRRLPRDDQEAILEYLTEFKLYETVEVGGKEYVLVHAGLTNFDEERSLSSYDLSEVLFQRPDYEIKYFKDKYLVTGHTPTRVAYAAERGVLLEELSSDEYQDLIFKKNNHIAIDCGSSFGGNLGCICLDTLEEYYV